MLKSLFGNKRTKEKFLVNTGTQNPLGDPRYRLPPQYLYKILCTTCNCIEIFILFTQNYEKDKHKQQDVMDPTTPSLRVENSRTLTTQEKCDLPHFKQLTRIILESFPTPGKRYATIELSDDDLKMLQEFKDNDVEGKKMYDVLELIIDIFKRIQEDERLEQTFLTRILAFVEHHKEVFAVIFIISILIFILLIFETRTTMPWYRQCWYLFGLLFIVSIPWEWFRLYRKEYAEKQAELIKEMPSHCASKNMTITERMSLWMTGLLSWSEDDCIKFQEAILVDPVWEVSPSVVSKQFSLEFFRCWYCYIFTC